MTRRELIEVFMMSISTVEKLGHTIILILKSDESLRISTKNKSPREFFFSIFFIFIFFMPGSKFRLCH